MPGVLESEHMPPETVGSPHWAPSQSARIPPPLTRGSGPDRAAVTIPVDGAPVSLMHIGRIAAACGSAFMKTYFS